MLGLIQHLRLYQQECHNPTGGPWYLCPSCEKDQVEMDRVIDELFEEYETPDEEV